MSMASKKHPAELVMAYKGKRFLISFCTEEERKEEIRRVVYEMEQRDYENGRYKTVC